MIMLRINSSNVLLSAVTLWLLNNVNAMYLNGTALTSEISSSFPPRIYNHNNFTIEDLLHRKFEFKVSDDIDMDPCKSSKCVAIKCVVFSLGQD